MCMKILNSTLFAFGALALTNSFAIFAEESEKPAISPADFSGKYWAVQQDMIYGGLQHECSVEVDETGKVKFIDYPIPDGYPVEGQLNDDFTSISIPNGQLIHKDSYGKGEYFWSAIPDDPVTNYDVEADKEIIFDVNPESRQFSWIAPSTTNAIETYFHRFLMTGSKYVENETWKISGYYHFTKAILYPLNSTFSGERSNIDGSEESLEHSLWVECDKNEMRVYGLLHLDHSTPLHFALDKEAGSVTLTGDGFVCNDEELGKFYVKTPDGKPLTGFAYLSEDGTEIELGSFEISDETDEATGGAFKKSSLLIPFDIFANVPESEDPDDNGVENPCDIDSDGSASANPKYFNLQGAEISAPQKGITICITNGKVAKIVK